jgi:hypothetical protein
MKNIYFLMALFWALGAHGQHFSPFRPGAMVQYSAVAGDTVRLLQLQRRGYAGVNGADSLYLFAERAGAPQNASGTAAFGGCWPRYGGGPFGQALGIRFPGAMRAEYRLLGAYNPLQGYYGSDLLLKPRAPLAQVWTADSDWGTTARVVSRAVLPVLGVPDSVVTIAFSGGQQLMLSKFHGLVEGPALAYFAIWGAPRRQVLTALPGARLGQTLLGALAVYDFQPGDRFVYRYDQNTSVGGSPTPVPPLSYLLADSILSRTSSRAGDTLTYRVLTCSQQGNRASAIATLRYTSASGPGTRTSQQYLRGNSPLASVSNLFSGTMVYDAVRGPYPTSRPEQRVAYLSLCYGDTAASYASPTIDHYAGASYAVGLGCVSNYVSDHYGTSTSTTLVGYRKGSETWGQLPRLLCSPLAATSSQPAATTAAFPNPFEAELSVTFVLRGPQTVVLALHDALGRVVLQRNEARLAVGPQQLSLATAGLPAGLYTLHLSFVQSSRTEVLKVLKRH